VLTSIRSLLAEPNPDDPLMKDIVRGRVPGRGAIVVRLYLPTVHLHLTGSPVRSRLFASSVDGSVQDQL
jgi:hypothetical protein